MRFLTYAIGDDGIVTSRINDHGGLDDSLVMATPVLQWDELGKDGDFSGPLVYRLEKVPTRAFDPSWWRTAKWTRKIPIELKNRHRAFWGMKPLRGAPMQP